MTQSAQSAVEVYLLQIPGLSFQFKMNLREGVLHYMKIHTYIIYEFFNHVVGSLLLSSLNLIINQINDIADLLILPSCGKLVHCVAVLQGGGTSHVDNGGGFDELNVR
jgi:hypothetical protein